MVRGLLLYTRCAADTAAGEFFILRRANSILNLVKDIISNNDTRSEFTLDSQRTRCCAERTSDN